MSSPYLQKNCSGTIASNVVHSISESIIPKLNVIARLEFEFAYYDVIAQHFNPYAMGDTLKQKLTI